MSKSKFTEEVKQEILDRIAKGESLSSICKDKRMPAYCNVMVYLGKHKDYQESYARAREMQADTIFDQMLDIADEAERDLFEDGSTNHEVIQRAKLRIDTRKWVLGKMKPKKYGDKVDMNIDLDAKVETTIVEVVTKDQVDDDDIGYVES